jgi:hypothetical protein
LPAPFCAGSCVMPATTAVARAAGAECRSGAARRRPERPPVVA